MPYDTMDKFVALSKCLAGFPDKLRSESHFIELEDRTIKYMLRLLDGMDPQSRAAGESVADHVAQHGGVVAAPGVVVEPTLPQVVLPEIRDTLFKRIKIVQDQFFRGVTYADVHPKYIDTLTQLAGLANKMAEVLREYQKDVKAADQHFE